jgi:hypothetical protein
MVAGSQRQTERFPNQVGHLLDPRAAEVAQRERTLVCATWDPSQSSTDVK